MKHLGQNIIKSYHDESNDNLDDLPDVPNYKEIRDHTEAKEVMKDYLETVIEKVEKQPLPPKTTDPRH